MPNYPASFQLVVPPPRVYLARNAMGYVSPPKSTAVRSDGVAVASQVA